MPDSDAQRHAEAVKRRAEFERTKRGASSRKIKIRLAAVGLLP